MTYNLYPCLPELPDFTRIPPFLSLSVPIFFYLSLILLYLRCSFFCKYFISIYFFIYIYIIEHIYSIYFFFSYITNTLTSWCSSYGKSKNHETAGQTRLIISCSLTLYLSVCCHISPLQYKGTQNTVYDNSRARYFESCL